MHHTVKTRKKFKEYDEKLVSFINKKNNKIDYIHYELIFNIARELYESRIR